MSCSEARQTTWLSRMMLENLNIQQEHFRVVSLHMVNQINLIKKELHKFVPLGKFISLTLLTILRIQETLKRLIKELSYREQQRLLITVNSENQTMLEFHLVLMLFTREVYRYQKNLSVTEELIDHKLHWKLFSKTTSVKLLDPIFSKLMLNWKQVKVLKALTLKLMSDIQMHRSKQMILLKQRIHLMLSVKPEKNSNLKDSKILIQKLTINDEKLTFLRNKVNIKPIYFLHFDKLDR